VTIYQFENAYLFLLLFYTLGAVVPFFIRHNRKMSLKLGCLLGAGGSLLGLWIGIEGLIFNEIHSFSLANVLPGLSMGITLDKLSAFFLMSLLH